MVLLVDDVKLLLERRLAEPHFPDIANLVSYESDPFAGIAFTKGPAERSLGLYVQKSFVVFAPSLQDARGRAFCPPDPSRVTRAAIYNSKCKMLNYNIITVLFEAECRRYLAKFKK